MTETQRKEPVIALLGQPNSGKSTLFNGLTGLKQHVGNWPGKTVEQKEGYFVRSNQRYTVVDLPGTYSLSANSEEEIITRDYIAEGNADAVCILADASQLERSLFMLADFAGIRTPAFLLLNMMDVAKDQGKTIDPQRLEKNWEFPWWHFRLPMADITMDFTGRSTGFCGTGRCWIPGTWSRSIRRRRDLPGLRS